MKESKVWDDEVENDENILYDDMEDFADMPLAFPSDAGLSQNILSPNPISPGSSSSSSDNSYFIQQPLNIKSNNQLTSFIQNGQFNSSSNAETDLRDVKVEVELQEYLFNRLQWYYVTCRFTDNDVSSRTRFTNFFFLDFANWRRLVFLGQGRIIWSPHCI